MTARGRPVPGPFALTFATTGGLAGTVHRGPSGNEIALYAGIGLWLLAAIEATLAIRQAPV